MTLGWHEYITSVSAETRIAYVYEDGTIYFPEGGDPEDFTLANASGTVYPLVRAEPATLANEFARAYVGTCDFGDCDDPTEAIVYAESPGEYLSMCAGHAVTTLNHEKEG
jgi:hypothetical protein